MLHRNLHTEYTFFFFTAAGPSHKIEAHYYRDGRSRDLVAMLLRDRDDALISRSQPHSAGSVPSHCISRGEPDQPKIHITCIPPTIIFPLHRRIIHLLLWVLGASRSTHTHTTADSRLFLPGLNIGFHGADVLRHDYYVWELLFIARRRCSCVCCCPSRPNYL
jgi:hypothetical protein